MEPPGEVGEEAGSLVQVEDDRSPGAGLPKQQHFLECTVWSLMHLYSSPLISDSAIFFKTIVTSRLERKCSLEMCKG